MNECLTTPQHKKQIGYWVYINKVKQALKVTIYQNGSVFEKKDSIKLKLKNKGYVFLKDCFHK